MRSDRSFRSVPRVQLEEKGEIALNAKARAPEQGSGNGAQGQPKKQKLGATARLGWKKWVVFCGLMLPGILWLSASVMQEVLQVLATGNAGQSWGAVLMQMLSGGTSPALAVTTMTGLFAFRFLAPSGRSAGVVEGGVPATARFATVNGDSLGAATWEAQRVASKFQDEVDRAGEAVLANSSRIKAAITELAAQREMLTNAQTETYGVLTASRNYAREVQEELRAALNTELQVITSNLQKGLKDGTRQLEDTATAITDQLSRRVGDLQGRIQQEAQRTEALLEEVGSTLARASATVQGDITRRTNDAANQLKDALGAIPDNLMMQFRSSVANLDETLEAKTKALIALLDDREGKLHLAAEGAASGRLSPLVERVRSLEVNVDRFIEKWDKISSAIASVDARTDKITEQQKILNSGSREIAEYLQSAGASVIALPEQLAIVVEDTDRQIAEFRVQLERSIQSLNRGWTGQIVENVNGAASSIDGLKAELEEISGEMTISSSRILNTLVSMKKDLKEEYVKEIEGIARAGGVAFTDLSRGLSRVMQEVHSAVTSMERMGLDSSRPSAPLVESPPPIQSRPAPRISTREMDPRTRRT